MHLFNETIAGWDDWGKVYQSIPAFRRLAAYILTKENLPPAELELLAPGTNAVFRAGESVIKIFAPPESGNDQTGSMRTELLAMRHANARGICAPEVLAHGFLDDKYRFAYLVMEFVEGTMMLDSAVANMRDEAKMDFGRALRAVTDKINGASIGAGGREELTRFEVLDDKDPWGLWKKLPQRFQEERRAYLKAHDFGNFVLVHGDLNGDNILVTPQGQLMVLDFADAVMAPVEYEHALIAATFGYDKAFLRGFFENDTERLVERCFHGTLLHEFGGAIIAERLGGPAEFTSLERLRAKLDTVIEEALL